MSKFTLLYDRTRDVHSYISKGEVNGKKSPADVLTASVVQYMHAQGHLGAEPSKPGANASTKENREYERDKIEYDGAEIALQHAKREIVDYAKKFARAQIALADKTVSETERLIKAERTGKRFLGVVSYSPKPEQGYVGNSISSTRMYVNSRKDMVDTIKSQLNGMSLDNKDLEDLGNYAKSFSGILGKLDNAQGLHTETVADVKKRADERKQVELTRKEEEKKAKEAAENAKKQREALEKEERESRGLQRDFEQEQRRHERVMKKLLSK